MPADTAPDAPCPAPAEPMLPLLASETADGQALQTALHDVTAVVQTAYGKCQPAGADFTAVGGLSGIGLQSCACGNKTAVVQAV
ncbi:hypothetical protein [Neisseria chenwenguii]|uniref:hypothetical protein n=1 Tax=Neisseria chenwenguii TaxID=1853278 RepID=UPI000B5B2632|nr:hypothetical protein [Neisseria chenwenguii]ROV55388.1 hypothetical protein EGS38_10100 [Neisseria chenwenguii]